MLCLPSCLRSCHRKADRSSYRARARVEASCSSSLLDDSTRVERVVEAVDGVVGCGFGPALQSVVWCIGAVSEEARWDASDVCGLPGTE